MTRLRGVEKRFTRREFVTREKHSNRVPATTALPALGRVDRIGKKAAGSAV